MKISVTRALTEIKHLQDKINRASQEKFLACTKGKDSFAVVQGSNKSIAETTSEIQSNWQSVKDLIARRAALKSAVSASNAVTKVKVLDKEITVAQAIEEKSSVQFKQTLLNTLRSQFLQVKGAVEAHNNRLYEEIDTAVQVAYGNDKGKVDSEQYDAVAKPRLQRHSFDMLDPIKIESKIKELQVEIENFNCEIDFVLSESNSSTFIEI
jgi:hypothetical protein